MIIDAKEHFKTDAKKRHQEWNLYRGKHLKRMVKEEYLGMAPIRAEINHSRWIANCPWCNGAEFVFIDEPRFYCNSCDNDGQDKYVRVILPTNRQGIENALNKRPRLENRNWRYQETIADLNRENRERGIG